MAYQRKKEELAEELRDAGLPTEGTKDELLERVEELKAGDVHVPDTFAARFDPNDPPAEDPGPAYRE